MGRTTVYESDRLVHLHIFADGDSGGIAGYLNGRIRGCALTGDGASRSMIIYYGTGSSRSVRGIEGFDDGGEMESCNVLSTHPEYTGDSNLQPRLGYLVGHQQGGKILSCGCDRDQDVQNRSDYRASAHEGEVCDGHLVRRQDRRRCHGEVNILIGYGRRVSVSCPMFSSHFRGLVSGLILSISVG